MIETPIVSTVAHRENLPAIDLDMVERRCVERDAAAVGRSEAVADAIRSDTQMIRALASEVRRQTIGADALRAVVASFKKNTGAAP